MFAYIAQQLLLLSYGMQTICFLFVQKNSMESSSQRVNLDLKAVAINEFIQSTVEFLNSFATQYEELYSGELL